MPQTGLFLKGSSLFSKQIGKIISGLAIGSVIGAGAAPVFGGICGMAEVAVITWIYPPNVWEKPGDPSIGMFVLVLISEMIRFGVALGALTGMIVATINRRWSGIVTAALLGMGPPIVVVAIFTTQPLAAFGMFYLPSVMTCLLSAVAVKAIVRPVNTQTK